MTARKNFIVLVSTAPGSPQTSLVAIKAIVERLKRHVDPQAVPACPTAAGTGVLVSADTTAHAIWRIAWPDDIDPTHEQAISDMLVIQLGPDHCSSPDARAGAWLQSRRGTGAG